MSKIRSASLFAILSALAVLSVPQARAVNGSWTTGVSGTWSVAGNWVGGTIANGVSSTATVAFNPAGQTLTLTTSQTTGILNVSSATAGFTVAGSGAGTLVMNNGGLEAQINVTGSSSTISAPVVMTPGGLRIDALSGGASAFTLSNVSASGFSGTQILSASQAGTSLYSINNLADSGLGAQAGLLLRGGTYSMDTNSFSGGMTIRSGGVRLAAAGAGTGSITLGDASSTAVGASIATTSSGTYFNDIVVYNGLQTPTISQYVTGVPVVFAGNVSLGKRLEVLPQNGGSFTFSGNIGGVEGMIFQQNNGGDNRVVLSGSNTFAGGLTVATSGLTIGVGNAAALGSGTLSFGTTNRLRVGLDNTSGGALTLSTNNVQIWSNFTFVGSNSLNMGTGGVTIGPATAIVTVQSNTLTVGGVISGASKRVGNAGPGTLALNGANTYTGATTVGGVLSANTLANSGSASSIGASTALAANLILNRGTLRYTGAAVSTDRLFTIGNGGATIDGSGSGAVNFTNAGSYVSTDDVPITLAAGTAGTGFVATGTVVNNVDTANLAVGMSITGAGLAPGTTIAAILDGNRFTLNQAATGASTASSYTFGALNRTITLAGSNTGSNTLSGVLANSTTKTLSVSKTGGGKWVLTGSNTYTGNTTVSAGTLVLATAGNNNIASSPRITVASGASLDVTGVAGAGGFTLASGQTLAGGGTVVGALRVGNNSTLSPGSSPGTLSQTGNQTWLNGGNYNWQIYDATGLAGVGYDTVAVTGILDLTSLTGVTDFNINLWSLSGIGPDVNGNAINFNSAINQSWTLVSTTGGVTGFDLGDFTINIGAFNGTGGFSNAFPGSFSVNVVGNDLVLLYSIPEPGTTALLATGVGMFLLLRRRRSTRISR